MHITMRNCMNCNVEFQFSRNTCGKYCSNRCQHDFQFNEKFNKFVRGENIIRGYRLVKRCLILKYGEKCAICEIDSWRACPITLEVDHMSGNRKDNSITNVRLLCPNCHSQTDTYRTKNKK